MAFERAQLSSSRQVPRTITMPADFSRSWPVAAASIRPFGANCTQVIARSSGWNVCKGRAAVESHRRTTPFLSPDAIKRVVGRKRDRGDCALVAFESGDSLVGLSVVERERSRWPAGDILRTVGRCCQGG